MNISPFESLEDMAKWSFFTLDELKVMAAHTDDYSKGMLATIVTGCVNRKAFSESGYAGDERQQNQAADIGKEWSTTSRVVRGGHSQITYGAKSMKRAKVL
jgi:outer membrane lipoprotein SlyB